MSKFKRQQYIEFLEKIEEFSEQDWVKSRISGGNPNFWQIIEYGYQPKEKGKSAHEIRSSKMLKWLMDPRENHRLGNKFVYEFLKENQKDLNYPYYEYNSDEANSVYCESETVNNIDVYYEDKAKNIAIVIELKQYSPEGICEDNGSQLEKYKNYIDTEKKEKLNLTPFYYYITPKGDEPSVKSYKAIDYEVIIKVLDNILDSLNITEHNMHVYKILLDFRDDLINTCNVLDDNGRDFYNALDEDNKNIATDLKQEQNDEHKKFEIFDELIKVNNETFKIKKLDMILEIFLEYVTIQNTETNENIRLLAAEVYNYFVKEEDRIESIDNIPSVAKKHASIKEEIIKKYDLRVSKIDVGYQNHQSLFFKHECEYCDNDNKDKECNNEDCSSHIYIGGGYENTFPKEVKWMSTRTGKLEVGIKSIDELKTRQFEVFKDNEEVKLKNLKENKTISVNEFIENHLLPALKTLSANYIER